MSMLIVRSDDADSVKKEQAAVPPLFAGPLRDDMAERIASALAAGDHEKAAVLLHESDGAFPNDPTFAPLRTRCGKLAQRKAEFEATLQLALEELSEDRFASSAAKFREALSLSRGHEVFSKKIFDTGVDAAEKQAERHWRFAEALLDELSRVAKQPIGNGPLWIAIERVKREENVRVSLEESGRAEHTAYLPHLRDHLAELSETYPDSEPLHSRLQVLDGLVAQGIADEREKNLRRLNLFRDRLDFTNNPETLQRFADLAAPFIDPYRTDPAFLAVMAEIRDLRSRYESASLLLEESRLQDAMLICDQVLHKRPANVLFSALEQQAKEREWLARRVASTTHRARVFEENAQYAEALDEWESLREIAPRHPGLDSEILHCAALKGQAAIIRTFQPALADETALIPEIIDVQPVIEAVAEPIEEEPPSAMMLPEPLRSRRARVRIVITAGAWSNFKTGVVAAFAVLLIFLVFASNNKP